MLIFGRDATKVCPILIAGVTRKGERQKVFPIASEGFQFLVWGSGGWTCVRVVCAVGSRCPFGVVAVSSRCLLGVVGVSSLVPWRGDWRVPWGLLVGVSRVWRRVIGIGGEKSCGWRRVRYAQ